MRIAHFFCFIKSNNLLLMVIIKSRNFGELMRLKREFFLSLDNYKFDLKKRSLATKQTI